ncbi:MAG TPA: hypothetical protein VFR86_16525 [Burkholderiaceae bacterium]|nr:hypothetical protein [Burkholderiaceae bacterium]
MLAVGAPFENARSRSTSIDLFNDGQRQGRVYLFKHRHIRLARAQILTVSNAAASDLFGMDVVFSNDGSTLAVGAPGEDSASTGVNGDQHNDARPESGAIYNGGAIPRPPRSAFSVQAIALKRSVGPSATVHCCCPSRADGR